MDFAKASGLTLRESGTVEVDRFSLETSRSKFYAGGDVITGASNVSNAMGLGKKAARNIDERLMGAKRIRQLARTFEYDQTPPAQPSAAVRQIPDSMPARERVQNFDEVSLGLTAAEALEEASRCLRCDIRATGPVTRGATSLPQENIHSNRRRIRGGPRRADHSRSRQGEREIHSHAVLPRRTLRLRRLPVVRGGGLGRGPPADRLHDRGAGRHVRDHQLREARALPPDGARTSLLRTQSLLRRLRIERPLRVAGHGARGSA